MLNSVKYRITIRGKQAYIMPLVGESFTDNVRIYIVRKLRKAGYFVSVISPGRIAYSKITGNLCPSLSHVLGF